MNERLAQKLILNGLYWSKAYLAAAPFTRGQGAVLMFHRVRPASDARLGANAGLEVTPEFLSAVVTRIREHQIDIVDLDEALNRIDRAGSRRFCVLTFDDGYRDNLEYAYPVLKAAGAPFTIYVATGLVDGTAEIWWEVLERVVENQDGIAIDLGGSVEYLQARGRMEKLAAFARIMAHMVEIDEDRQRAAMRELTWKYGIDGKAYTAGEIMTWEEIRRLAADPLVTIGAHTVGHYALGKLPLDRARAEMRDGARVIEASIGKPPRHFAYPYGSPQAAAEREFRLAGELGFASAVTTRPGVLIASSRETPTAWPRVSINGHFQSVRYLDVFLSGTVQALYALATRQARPTAAAIAKAAASIG